MSAMTLASPGDADEGSGASAPDADLTASFGDLPPDRQLALLENGWDRLDHERVRPALRRVVETAPDASPDRLDREPDARSLALRRLAELDPEGTRTLLLAELARFPLRVDPRTLAVLPDETLPELDAALGEHLDSEARDFELRLRAVERYASPALAPRVTALYASARGVLSVDGARPRGARP